MSTYKIITNGPHFMVGLSHLPNPFGWATHFNGFASKEAAQEWMWDEMECWESLDRKPKQSAEAA